MEVWNYDVDGRAVERIPVPVKLTYKEKVISQLLKGNTSNPNTFRDNENVLPMISIEWKGMEYDSSRARGLREKRRLYLEYDTDESLCLPTQKVHMDYQTVPYKLRFEVIVWAKYMDHLVQLVENIDPFLHPEIYLSFYEKGLGNERKIKVTKVSENPTFSPDIGPNEFRSKHLLWRMGFEVECNLYKPELPVGVPIKRVITRFSSTQSTQNTGIELDNIITAQTQDTETTPTTGVSGCDNLCFSDLDAEIVSYIRRYTDGEFALQEQMRPYIGCESPQDKEPPPEPPVPYPLFFNGMIPVIDSEQNYLITRSDLVGDYEVIVNIFDSQGSPVEIPYSVDKDEGEFTITISAEIGYNIVWYTYPVYNRRE